jgi:polyferredoxin
MSVDAINGFMQSPYYKMADVKMLYFFTRMSMLTAVAIGILIIGSLLVRNFWCRYFCPYGALIGIFAILSPTRIYRNPQTCIHCEQCDRTCPSHLLVSQKNRIDSPECTGCLDCVGACPVEQALQFQSVIIKKTEWKTTALGITMLFIFFGIVSIAHISGHWQSVVSAREFAIRLKIIDSPEVAHPSYRLKHDNK